MHDAASSEAMLARPALLLALLALGAVAFAGCASEEPSAGTGDTPAPAGETGDQAASGPDGSAPEWAVGQWWDHKWFFGSTASDPFTVKTIVAEDKGSSWLVATDDALTSALHAAFLFPTLGDFPKGEVTATVGEFSWPWYQFPLSANQTWTAAVSTRDGSGGTYALPLVATVQAATGIVTAAGLEDGFDVEVRTAGSDGIEAGRLFARYDYVPAIGWMSRATFYDVTQAEETPQFILEMSATGTGYSGPYFDTSGDVLSTHFNLFVPTAPAPPNPTSAFVVTEAHTQVLAFAFNFAAGGSHTTQILAPDGQHWESLMAADADGNVLHSMDTAGGMLFVPAVAGEWHVNTVGAGAFVAGGGIQAYGITQRASQL
jgi:hypothetical protein